MSTLDPPELINAVSPQGSTPFTPMETSVCAEPQPDTECAQRRNADRVRRAQAEHQCAPDQCGEQHEYQQDTGESEFLGDHGEDEIGMGFGQVKQFLHAGT